MIRSSKKVNIGNISIGGGQPIAIQSMAGFKISDTGRAIEEVNRLVPLGLDIMRFSVADELDAKAFSVVKKACKTPLVADIHFDYKLALLAIDGGADKIRINPGNIGSREGVKEVALALRQNGIPVRVGSNTGSIEKEFLQKYGVSAKALGESALKRLACFEEFGVDNIVISVKASDCKLMVDAYEYVAQKTQYPLHLGVTEAGTEFAGIIKNSIGIGSLLLKGIGDTIRVSLSADNQKEVLAGKQILSALNLKNDCAKIIACPTCGRCKWDCMGFAQRVEELTKGITKAVKIAVMGCAVNGPGEAREADIGVAGGDGCCVLFAKGKIIKKVAEEEIEKAFLEELNKCLQ